MPKRDQTPPYELMRSSTRPPQAEAPEGAASDASAVSENDNPTPVTAGSAPWWVGSSSPLVLRIPRGIAVLGVAGLLLLIVLAYIVGAARGAAAVEPDTEQLVSGDRPGPAGWFEAQQTGYEGTEVQTPEKPEIAERREIGLNYMVLMSSSRKSECEDLAAFFGARGVAIQLVPSHNSRSWIAIAVRRGYRADELKSESRKLYEQQLRALGRQWKQNGGSSDLSTMYFDRYDG